MTEHAANILMVCQCFPPQLGGIQALMGDLAEGLAQHQNVHVITKQQPGSKPWDETQPYTTSRVAGPRLWRRRLTARRVQDYLRAHTVSVVITDTWKSAEVIAPLAAQHQVPVIALAHGSDVLSQDKRRREERMRNTFQQCRHIIAVSHYTAELIDSLGLHATVIPNGVKASTALATESKIESIKGQPMLLSIARLEARKGMDQVIRSLPTLKQRWPTIQYVIAGSGHDRQRLQMLCKALQVDDRVHFLGRVDDKQKTKLLAQADLFAMPVRHDTTQHSVEGFGIALVEAQLASCPVLTGQVGGVLDVVKHGETGFCCDGDDWVSVRNQIAFMLSNPDPVQDCIEKAFEHAEKHFSHKQMIWRYEQLIGSL